MITQISGLNGNSAVAKDPRRKAQSVRFKHHSMVSYKQKYNFNEAYHNPKKNALINSIVIVAGATAFTIGYFAITGLKQAKI